MKILSFFATNVHGTFNLKIDFSRNPTILIAPNGAGKTTALKLIQALLTPDLATLMELRFFEAHVMFEEDSRSKSISASKPRNGSSLYVRHSDVSDEISIPTALAGEISDDSSSSRRRYEIDRALRLKYGDHPTYIAIAETNKPVFLGLDRLNRTSFSEDNVLAPRSRAQTAPRTTTSNIGLSESARLVRSAYRTMRVIKDGRSEKLRNELLFSGFEFASISSSELTDTLNVREYFVYEKLEKQRADLSKALDSIGIDSEKSREAINGFFDKAKILSQKVSEKRYAPTPELMFEAAINRFAIRRFEQLVSKIQKNNNNTGLTKKFSSFIGDLNTFFADSRKEAKIDAIGLLKFETSTKEEITPEQLSSGEQQLLVMFSHLHFNGFGDKSNVFVFDEPEVSLHLRWQELLLPRMLNSSPRAQIIVATHSPEIVGELLDHCVDINSD